MKYADSFNDSETIIASGATTYSDWFDTSWANELCSFATFAEAVTGTTESITVSLQRFSPIVTTGTDIAAHGALAAAGSDELYVTSQIAGSTDLATKNKLGMRVRYKYVSSGTFSASQIVTMTMVLYAKRN